VTIEVVTRSYRSVRGRSVCVAVLDELAFWRDDDSANPDSEVLNAVRASMATFGGDAMVISSIGIPQMSTNIPQMGATSSPILT
jgi:hypothetical protein